MKNLIFAVLVGLLILSCTETPDKEDRINPFDSKGDNWYPPVVMVDQDTVYGEVKDYTPISVTMFDYNSKISTIEWSLENDSVIEIDSVKNFVDSTIVYDTIIKIDTSGFDTIAIFDTSDYKSNLIDVDLSEYKDTVTFFMYSLDTANGDTLADTISFLEDSDTIYIKTKVDSLINVSKIVTSYEAFPVIDTLKTVAIDAVYYSFLTKFIFESPDTLLLYVKVTDSDGIESEEKDSVVIIISDSLSNF